MVRVVKYRKGELALLALAPLAILSAVQLLATPVKASEKPAGEMVFSGAFTPVLEIVAQEADQGVASDGEFVYAIDNNIIGKYAIKTGKRVDRWEGGSRPFSAYE